MARIIHFPVAVRTAQISRSRRVFEAQRELEATQRSAAHLGLLAIGVVSVALGVLELIALGVLG